MSTDPTTIGRYQIVNRLGAGGMGSVYLARDPDLDRLVAIKLVKDDLSDDPDLRERFSREARSAARLRHPNIVTIFDIGEERGQPFIAMEYLHGESLLDIVRKRTPLDVSLVLRWMEDLCAGLAHAHQAGIVHRDIKPANMMIDQDGLLKVVDFGIARLGDSQVTRDGVLVGTINYMSPEQIQGKGADARSDIFAVGAVFYELLTLRQAFPGGLHDGLYNRICTDPIEPLRAICPDLDQDVIRIVDLALQKDRDARYQDLTAMKADIARVRHHLGADAGPTTIIRQDEATSTIARGSSPRATSGPGSGPRPGDSGRSGQHSAAETNRARDSAEDDELRQQHRKAGLFIDAAEIAFAQRDYTRTSALLDDAERLSPSVPGLEKLRTETAAAIAAADEASRRSGDVDRALGAARRAFDRGEFAAARDYVGRALALDPANWAAQSLSVRLQTREPAREGRGQVASSAGSPRPSGGRLWVTVLIIMTIVAAVILAVTQFTR